MNPQLILQATAGGQAQNIMQFSTSFSFTQQNLKLLWSLGKVLGKIHPKGTGRDTLLLG